MTVQKPDLTKAQPTALITFLQDRSGSMAIVQDATIESFNGYLAGLQRETQADIDFSYLQFDTVSLDKVHTAIPVREARMLTKDTFVPRGGTPLVEASIKTIEAVEASLAKRTDHPRVTVCIQTDGQENASKSEYTWERLKKLIEAKQEAGWQFNFMGAGLESYAYQQAARMGVGHGSTMSYNHTNLAESQQAFAATASNTASFAAGRSANTQYSVQQKTASGDVSQGVAGLSGAVRDAIQRGVQTPDLTGLSTSVKSDPQPTPEG